MLDLLAKSFDTILMIALSIISGALMWVIRHLKGDVQVMIHEAIGTHEAEEKKIYEDIRLSMARANEHLTEKVGDLAEGIAGLDGFVRGFIKGAGEPK